MNLTKISQFRMLCKTVYRLGRDDNEKSTTGRKANWFRLLVGERTGVVTAVLLCGPVCYDCTVCRWVGVLVSVVKVSRNKTVTNV